MKAPRITMNGLSPEQQERVRQLKREAVQKEQDQVTLFLAGKGIPHPVFEHRFHAERQWRFDLAWPRQKVALEIQGGAWKRGYHTHGEGFLNDIDKSNEAQLGGWLLLKCTPSNLCTDATAEMIRRALQENTPA